MDLNRAHVALRTALIIWVSGGAEGDPNSTGITRMELKMVGADLY